MWMLLSTMLSVNSIFLKFLFLHLFLLSLSFHFSPQGMSLMATSKWGNMLVSFPRMFKTAVQEMLHIFSQFRVTERKFEDAKETEQDGQCRGSVIKVWMSPRDRQWVNWIKAKDEFHLRAVNKRLVELLKVKNCCCSMLSKWSTGFLLIFWVFIWTLKTKDVRKRIYLIMISSIEKPLLFTTLRFYSL